MAQAWPVVESQPVILNTRGSNHFLHHLHRRHAHRLEQLRQVDRVHPAEALPLGAVFDDQVDEVAARVHVQE
jgi:hypothetical protein